MQVQFSPCVVPAPRPTTIGTAVSRSASSRMIAADLPPSSSTQRLTCAPQTSPIFLPTSVEPVNVTMSTSGWATRCSDASRVAATMLITPGGNPASVTRSAIANSVSGSGSGALTTAVQPATIAGAIFWAIPGSGKLNARQRRHDADRLAHEQALALVLHDQPAGGAGHRREVRLAHLGEGVLAADLRVVVPVQRRRDRVVDVGGDLVVAELVHGQVGELGLHARRSAPRAAPSSPRARRPAASASPSRRTPCARPRPRDRCRSSLAAGTKPIFSPVAGEMTSKRSVESGSCQPPSM